MAYCGVNLANQFNAVRGQGVFDWDKDQESLVAASAEPQMIDSASGPTRLRGRLGLGLLGLVIMLGFAYEKNLLSQVRGASSIGLTLFDQPSFASVVVTLPEGLVAYDDAQAHEYLRGLRLADRATLQGYAVRVRSDLAHADAMLAPYFRDAETLILTELTRRAD
ncbi:hypothetical protein M3N55_10015 [Roseibaca sp. V10]|uniref:Uncharacterized protein n=1 Tax=Roseinatronobacter domitianus TaxID=2940293 RepID=A0ABT0M3U4_9RHOB|nr:hypothetical protein [Roseibaca domitiana]MCL1629065.1 hypothetical protein [Roseibaca domitiana]